MIEQRLAYWTNKHTHTHSSHWKVRWESVPIDSIKTSMYIRVHMAHAERNSRSDTEQQTEIDKMVRRGDVKNIWFIFMRRI